MNLGAFWDAASPGINSAIDTAHATHLHSITQQHALEMSLIDKLLAGDSEAQAYGRQKMIEIASPKHKPGSLLPELSEIFATGRLPGDEGAPPAAPATPAATPDVATSTAAATPVVPPATSNVAAGSAPKPSGQSAPMGGDAGAASGASTSPTQASAAPMKLSPAPVAQQPQAASAAPPPQGATAAGAGATTPGITGAVHPATVKAAQVLMPLAQTPQEQTHLAGLLADFNGIMNATGIKAPEKPDLNALREQTARQYGYSADQLEHPKFAYTDSHGRPSHWEDKQKSALQADYRQRLQHAQDQAGTEYRSEAGQYRTAAMGTLGQVYGSDRAAAAQEGADARTDKRIKVQEEGMNLRDKRRMEHEDRVASQYATTQADKAKLDEAAHLDRQAAALKPPMVAGMAIEKSDAKAKREAQVQQLRDQASSLRRSIIDRATAPPSMPQDPAKIQRLKSLADRARQLGGAQHLRPEERQELQDAAVAGVRL